MLGVGKYCPPSSNSVNWYYIKANKYDIMFLYTAMYCQSYWYRLGSFVVVIRQFEHYRKLAESVPILATSQAVRSFTITQPVLSNTLHLFHLATTAEAKWPLIIYSINLLDR